MEGGANFIPLGDSSARTSFEQGEKRIGKTKEERKQIAREYRLKAKKEKKKLKSDAKKQRKLNAILNRRMTRNNEKYDKNKDRNEARAIFLERWNIWNGAIHQAEHLAAKHDPSGKLFNVGEVVIMEDGAVKSKEALRKAKEDREEREREKAEFEAAKAAALEAKQALKEDRVPEQYSISVEGVNPQRQVFINNLEGKAGFIPKVPQKLSNKQRQRQNLYAPRPDPPKPVIPEGYEYPPEGEENFLSMWEITDEQILKRLVKQKQKKGVERRNLRVQQKAQKKINKQLKARKKQAANLGILFDKEKALKEIMGQKSESNDTSFEGDSYSSSDFESDSELEYDSDGGAITKDEKKSIKSEPTTPETESAKERKVWANRPQTPAEKATRKKSKKSSASDAAEDESESKKSKKSNVEDEASHPEINKAPAKVKKEKKKKPENHVPIPNSKTERKALKEADRKTKKEKKQLEKDAQRKRDKEELMHQKELARANEELAKRNLATKLAAVPDISPSEEMEAIKKRKRKRSNDEEVEATKNGTKEKKHKKDKTAKEADTVEKGTKEKKHKKHEIDKSAEESATNGDVKISAGAEQWNPEALTGGAARKEKFMRLLGAGKTNGDSSTKKHKSKSSTKTDDISHVQQDLEKQFEAGVKHKGSKRKGLGA